MNNGFSRSFTLLEDFAQDAVRTPPARTDSLTDYLDRSLTILGRTVKNQNWRVE